MSLGRSSLFLGVLAAISSGVISSSAPIANKIATTAKSFKRQQEAIFDREVWGEAPRRNGPGWTAAHVKRMARKKRNQQRHKAACRRKSQHHR